MEPSPLYSYLYSFVLPLAVKAGVYYWLFKWKEYDVTVLNCFLVAAGPLLPLSIIGLPVLLGWGVGVGVALYVLSQFTDVEPLPFGVTAVFSVEIGYAFVDRLIIYPIFF